MLRKQHRGFGGWGYKATKWHQGTPRVFEELCAIIHTFAPRAPLDSLNVAWGALFALRGPFGKIFVPKIEIREHHWTLKSDFGGSKTSRSRTKLRFSRPPHCFRCNGQPQHGFQSFPRHLPTATFSWGPRQWA